MSNGKPLRKVTATFNIFDHGRLGHKRNYDIGNVKKVIESPETRELIAMREAYGYYGHGRRQLAGKNKIEEFEAVNTPNGIITVENIPALVTTALDIDDNGTVTHEQEFLPTNPGRAALALYESKVGGFSWAMGGRDGGKFGRSIISGYHGMDYVLEPGFAKNRGFDLGILESATLAEDEQDAVYESMVAAGMSEDVAKVYVKEFFNPFMMMAEIQSQNDEFVNQVQDAEERLQKMEVKNNELQAQLEAERLQRQDLAGVRREKLIDYARSKHFSINKQVFESVDFDDIESELGILESIVRQSSKLSRLPVSSNRQSLTVQEHGRQAGKDSNFEYGSVQSAPSFD